MSQRCDQAEIKTFAAEYYHGPHVRWDGAGRAASLHFTSRQNAAGYESRFTNPAGIGGRRAIIHAAAQRGRPNPHRADEKLNRRSQIVISPLRGLYPVRK
ncbi:hypothetical protein [Rhodopseudomonas palustris]|uniref:hypothetical protein n=1 Tax=Rhodopseudomonas palustris TaxID=1076 RepID=UPI000300F4E8